MGAELSRHYLWGDWLPSNLLVHRGRSAWTYRSTRKFTWRLREYGIAKEFVLVRTSDEFETAAVIKQLVSKCSDNRPGIPTGGAPAAPLTKRKRDSDAHLVFLRMLQCIPSVSEGIARKIAEIFPTIPDLQRALSDMPTFPEIRLDQKRVLGKTRLTILRQHFCGDQEEKQPTKKGRSDNCSHVKVKCYPTGPRDNGEFDWRCSICGKEL